MRRTDVVMEVIEDTSDNQKDGVSGELPITVDSLMRFLLGVM